MSATSGESALEASRAKFTSLPPVERMSFASYQFLIDITDAVHRELFEVGLRAVLLVQAAATSSASGCWRNFSQTAGAFFGNGPADGAVSNLPLQVTERSPRRLMVSSALSWWASVNATRMPYCWTTVGSEIVASMRPYSMGRPLYWSKSGRTLETATVFVGYLMGWPAMMRPV
ncbi:MAG: hypothetical protein WDO56_16540, partial [Gammaproteobacteria bacterium]